MLLFFYQVFLLAYEEVELYSSVSVDRQPFKQSVNHLQQDAALITLGQDANHLHWDIWRDIHMITSPKHTHKRDPILHNALFPFSKDLSILLCRNCTPSHYSNAM